MTRWTEYEPDSVRERYNRIAPYYVPIEYFLATPPKLRRQAVARLDLRPGDHVLDIGVGSGRSLRRLVKAVGPEGHIYGVDLSEQMLKRASRRCEKHGWQNVTLHQGDASKIDVSEQFRGVLFCLAYSVMKDRRQILREVRDRLEPGGRIVIADVRVPVGRVRRLVEPYMHWISRKTVLANPAGRPWEDLGALAGEVGWETFGFGGWYFVCWGTKPATANTKTESFWRPTRACSSTVGPIQGQ